jgi:hypothetical protein
LHQLEDVKIEKNPMIDTNFSVDAGEGWYEAMVEELSPLFENFRHENSTAELMDKVCICFIFSGKLSCFSWARFQ